MNFPSHSDIRDRTIRLTDFDALSCRSAMVQKKYLDDPLVNTMVKGIQNNLVKVLGGPGNTLSLKRSLSINFSQQSLLQKLPIINRGTYLRTVSIDKICEKFVETNEVCQIIAIGAGSDTRGFRILSKYDNVNYIETDLLESVKLKISVIKENDILKSIINHNDSVNNELHTPDYHLLPLDLRKSENINSFLNSSFIKTIPTLILSECVLCYVDPEISTNVIGSFANRFKNGHFVLYEPMGLDDNFGSVMTSNLNLRGIRLPSLSVYSNIEKQKTRIQQCLKEKTNIHVHCSDMSFVYNEWIDILEKQRISRLELLDEIEEWILLSKHYCLVVASWGDGDLMKEFSWQISV